MAFSLPFAHHDLVRGYRSLFLASLGGKMPFSSRLGIYPLSLISINLALDGIRTHYLLFRKQSLYPSELRGHLLYFDFIIDASLKTTATIYKSRRRK